MIVIGLTGSIGMGKSTTAAMLEKLGIPVHDADAEAHALTTGKPTPAFRRAFPYLRYPALYTIKVGGRVINRNELARIALNDSKALDKLESVLHPLIRKEQNDFIRKHRTLGAKIVTLDVPLLFESGWDKHVDVTMVVSAPYKVQRARVLERLGMDEKKFRTILERQMPSREKCAQADYVIHTGLGRAHAMKELKAALRDIKEKLLSSHAAHPDMTPDGP